MVDVPVPLVLRRLRSRGQYQLGDVVGVQLGRRLRQARGKVRVTHARYPEATVKKKKNRKEEEEKRGSVKNGTRLGDVKEFWDDSTTIEGSCLISPQMAVGVTTVGGGAGEIGKGRFSETHVL